MSSTSTTCNLHTPGIELTVLAQLRTLLYAASATSVTYTECIFSCTYSECSRTLPCIQFSPHRIMYRCAQYRASMSIRNECFNFGYLSGPCALCAEKETGERAALKTPSLAE